MDDTELQSDTYFPLLSVSAAAQYLGVGRKTIYQLIELDSILAVREGKAIRLVKSSLDEFRASGQLT